MKSILIALVVIGLAYLVFIQDHQEAQVDNLPALIYQSEVEKAAELKPFMQNTVDKNLQETDKIN